MRTIHSGFALVSCALGLNAMAQATLGFEPATIHPTDTVTILFKAEDAAIASCPVIAPGGIALDRLPISLPGPSERRPIIDVFVTAAPDCAAAAASGPARLTLGRFPEGDYEVHVFESFATGSSTGQGVLSVQTAVGLFHVEPHRGSTTATLSPRDDYSGQWLTDLRGEGVTLSQQGNRLFATWLTYDDVGKPVWYVVPDFTYQVDAKQVGRFTGTAYASYGQMFPGGIIGGIGTFQGVRRVGQATLFERTADASRLEIAFDGITVPLKRELTRFRF